ncbi:YiiG family protein, partial [Salmonella enterica]|nr:YiiG family protein [Salmonella enterica]
IIIALIALGTTGCDDQKSQKSTSTDSSATSTSVNQNDSDAILAQKMNVYVECYNDINPMILSSVKGYTDWVDMDKGPTGKERYIRGMGDVTVDLDRCLAKITKVSSLKPELKPIDTLALNYINSSIDMKKIIREMNSYYTQEDYKDDAFTKAKTLHTQFMQTLSVFKPASEAYEDAIRTMNDQRQMLQLKKIEAKECKSFDYYSLSMMLISKKTNQLLQNDTKSGSFQREQFLEAADKYVLAVKTRVRRERDHIPLTDSDKENPAWAEGSFDKVIRGYNDLVTRFNLMN